MADQVFVSCPYNPSHSVLKKSYQKHITKCAKNFPTQNKKQCIFNAMHMVEEIEYDYHLANCPDKVNAERHMVSMEPGVPIRVIDVAEMNDIEIAITENWKEDPRQNKQFDPLKESENKLIYRPLTGGVSKAERKQYRRQEVERFNSLDVNSSIKKANPPSMDVHGNQNKDKLRLPKQPAQALISDKTSTNNTVVTKDVKTKENDSKNKNSSESTCSINYNYKELEHITNVNDTSKLLSAINVVDSVIQKENKSVEETSSDNFSYNVTVNDMNKKETNDTNVMNEISARLASITKLEEDLKKEKAKLYQQLIQHKQKNESTNPFKTQNNEMPKRSIGRGINLINDIYKRSERTKNESTVVKEDISYAQSLSMGNTKENKKSNIPKQSSVFYGYEETDEDDINN